MNDLRFAFRQLLKYKGSSFFAALILALCIGGTTAVYSVAAKVFLNPIPGRDSDRLVTVTEVETLRGFVSQVSPPLIRELSLQTDLLESLTYYSVLPEEQVMHVDGRAIRLVGARVAANFFSLLGILPHAGRTFLPDDGIGGFANVVVVSWALWQQALGGNPDLTGVVIDLDGVNYTVVGVMPPQIQFPGGPGRSQFWLPHAIPAVELNQPWEADFWHWRVIGHLREGVRLSQLQAALDAMATRWQQNLTEQRQRRWFLASHWDGGGSASLRTTLWTLQATVGTLLLIGCLNVAILLSSRAIIRRGEFGIRQAIGAGRWRIARQLLIESLSLAGVAALLGIVFARAGILALERFYLSGIPRIQVIDLDWGVLGIACMLSALVGILFGFLPTCICAKVNPSQALKEHAPQYRGGLLQRLFHDGLVITQVSLATVLLASAGLMIHSVCKLLLIETGIDPKNLYSFYYDVGSLMNASTAPTFEGVVRIDHSSPEASAEAFRAKAKRIVAWQKLMLERFQAMRGVESIAVNGSVGSAFDLVTVDGRNELKQVAIETISVSQGDYFRTVGASLVAGRLLTGGDAVPGESSVVINQKMADLCWPGQSPLGKRIHRVEGQTREFIVVGVIKNIRDRWRDFEIKPAIYEPFERLTHESTGGLFFTPGDYILRSRLSPEALRTAVSRVGGEMLPAVDLFAFQSVESQLYTSTAPRRIMMWLLISLGGLAMLLTALGVFSVQALEVARRTREVGIRIAMGACRNQVQSLFFRQGIRLIALGGVLGTMGFIMAGHYLESLLFGIELVDPWSLSGVMLTLGIGGGLACWLPARRAAKVDPMAALRSE